VTGYEADLPGMADAVRFLDDATQQLTPVPPMLDHPEGDLGPAGITESVEELTRRWAESVQTAQADATDTAAGLRAARHHYRSADEHALDQLGKTARDDD
jgi:hypothetical protein